MIEQSDLDCRERPAKIQFFHGWRAGAASIGSDRAAIGAIEDPGGLSAWAWRFSWRGGGRSAILSARVTPEPIARTSIKRDASQSILQSQALSCRTPPRAPARCALLRAGCARLSGRSAYCTRGLTGDKQGDSKGRRCPRHDQRY